MTFCLIEVLAMANISSYGPNLKNEIGGNGGHFQNGGRWISNKRLQALMKIILVKLLTYNLLNRVTKP
mgnify:CR=1 FL=1